jgi:hypothetical protein
MSLDSTDFNTSTSFEDAYQADSLSVGQSLTFSTTTNENSEEHAVIINTITKDSVSLTLHSDPITLTMSAGQSRLVDVNSDGKDDIGIEVVKITPPTASLKFWKVVSSAGQSYQAPLAPNTTSKGQPTTKSPAKWLWFMGGSLALCIVAAAWIYVTKHPKLKPGPS